MARFFFLFILLGSCLPTFCQKVHVKINYIQGTQNQSGDTIYYNPGRKLTWKDFKGAPKPNHFGGAVTASGFAYNADMEYDEKSIILNINVYTFFTRHDSWKKANINSSYHLEHEQKHFDITYLNTLKFIDQLKKARFTPGNFKVLPNQIFEKVYDENAAMQQKYDRETEHSINKEAQEIWNKRIDDQLAKSNKEVFSE